MANVLSFLFHMNVHTCTIALKFSFDLTERVRFALNSQLNALHSIQVSNLPKKKSAINVSIILWRV